MFRRSIVLLTVMIIAGRAGWHTSASESVISIEYLVYASRIDWCRSTNEVAFDRGQSDALYDVYLGLSSNNERCLTCNDTRFPGHNGNPAWHPAGQYLVFQAEDVTLPFLPVEKEPAKSKLTSPGWGTNNHLWFMTRDRASAWLVRRIEGGQGTLHPHFSRGGTKLTWAEKIGLVGTAEQWAVKVADVVWESGTPRLDNVVEIAPLGIDLLYETHGFSADDTKVIFSAGDAATKSLDIYTYELATGVLENLTNTPGVWDEHAHMSPDGTKIIWASSQDITATRNYFVPFLDFWMMDPDGSNRHRLTFFNEASHPNYIPSGAVTGDLSFSADGKTLLGRVELPKTDIGQRGEVIVRIKLQ